MTTPISPPKRRNPSKTRVQLRENRTESRWRTNAEQKSYFLKLFEAVRRVRRNSAPAPSQAVREAADRALAHAARARSRWSRSVLSRGYALNVHRKKVVNGGRRLRKGATGTCWLQRRVRVLGRLVPGCRKLMLPELLEETADYVGALEMQVRAMAALWVLLASSST